ncbi:MAG: response regulator [Betaproteobacteria bacterium]|nr:response regulator [Betaproteobacteria bacterium]
MNSTTSTSPLLYRTGMRDYNVSTRAYWWIVAGIGYALLAHALLLVAAMPAAAMVQIALAAAFVGAVAFFPVRIPGTKLSVAGGEIFIFLALLLFGVEAAIVAAALEGAIGAVRTSRRWTSWFGTPAMATVTIAVSGYGFLAARAALERADLLNGAVMMLMLTLFAILYSALSNLLPSLLLALKRNERLDVIALFKDRNWMAVAHVCSAAIAGLLYYAGAKFGAWVAFAASPTIVLSLSSAHFLFERAEVERRTQAALLDAANQQSLRAQTHAAAMVRSQARFHGAFTNAAIGMALVSATGEIRQVNPAVCNMLGYEESELLGGALRTFMPAKEFSILLNDIARITEGAGATTQHELLCIDKHGEEMGVAFSVADFGDGASESDFIVQMQDIRERKQAEAARASLEAQLRESQKMQAIGTLAGGIAHDFNNIMATILGNVELARQDASSNPLALESLSEIRKAGTRARDLVQQILSFSRRQATERRRIPLAPIIEESVRLLRATLPARITLEVHRDAGVPPVLADATQIQQVLINIATNAMQAIHAGTGHIGIRLETVQFDDAMAATHPALRALHARHPGRTVRLAVSDDGPGMDADTLERIFEPFFTTKEVGQGTGLGLSVVHGIVQTHEGAIVVDSQPGKGATFNIYLPAADAATDVAPIDTGAAMATPDIGGSRHILYLDDDESLVFLVQRLLERRGFRVSGYIDQREALDALRADPAAFDLVVTDYNMPGMSGLDVARAVRLIRSNLPVAVASGFIDEALHSQAEGAGVLELIFKANAVEDLCEAFARLAQSVPSKST